MIQHRTSLDREDAKTMSEVFLAKDREAWRDWLAKNHVDQKEVWLLIFKKKADKECVAYNDAVEEALCYGWIDGKVKRIDEEKHVIRFTPRKPKSVWSESNKARVRKMIKAGKMTEAGLKLVKAAKRSGQWQKAAEWANMDEVPADLEKALFDNDQARENFGNFASSYRKMYIGWILDAKRDETRQRRIRAVVNRAAQNKKPGIDM